MSSWSAISRRRPSGSVTASMRISGGDQPGREIGGLVVVVMLPLEALAPTPEVGHLGLDHLIRVPGGKPGPEDPRAVLPRRRQAPDHRATSPVSGAGAIRLGALPDLPVELNEHPIEIHLRGQSRHRRAAQSLSGPACGGPAASGLACRVWDSRRPAIAAGSHLWRPGLHSRVRPFPEPFPGAVLSAAWGSRTAPADSCGPGPMMKSRPSRRRTGRPPVPDPGTPRARA